ncbi:DNA cytosine methyltransferase [Pararhizobium qamdonense]|uniref:DNA cytosine methyltransferase n=1 Tax=Pararhizobium qamdonense TaxID=3031126 RepID=UPI0023E310BF|nr:DNA cytosine methyltransferase [Pararhizobium qamdonense]
MAGFHVSGAVEFNRDAMATFKANHPPTDFMAMRADIELFPMIMLSFTKGIDVVVGGPPCQPFSEAGLQNPLDERAHLFKEYVKLLNGVDRPHFKPPSAFIFENVEGLARVRDGADLKAIQTALAGCGYHLTTEILDASDYGVPQRRRRLIIVGSKFPGFRFPEPVAAEERRTLRDAIGDLPLPTENGEVQIRDGMVTGHQSPNHSRDLVDLIDQIPYGGRLRDLNLPNAPKAFAGSYARLRWERPSQTITSSFAKPSSARCIHPEQNRALTIREAARLQSFPDAYQFHGGTGSIRLQIGNAVPPLLAMHLGQALRNHLEENGVPFQNYQLPERGLISEEDKPWYLKEKQNQKFKEMLREKAGMEI